MQETRNDVQEPMVRLKKICVYIQNSSFCISCKQSSHAGLEQEENDDDSFWVNGLWTVWPSSLFHPFRNKTHELKG